MKFYFTSSNSKNAKNAKNKFIDFNSQSEPELANQNNANAQFNIALMYEQGLQTEQSYQMAFEWYKKSAALGNTQAQFNIDYLIKNNLIP